MLEQIISQKQVVRMTGIGERRIYRLMRAGLFPHRRSTGWSRAEVVRWIEEAEGDKMTEGTLRVIKATCERAAQTLISKEWRGLAGEIPRTGEEDPLALVDDPDLREVIAAKMELRRSMEARMFADLNFNGRRVAEQLSRLIDEPTGPRDPDFIDAMAKLSESVEPLIDSLPSSTPEDRDQQIATLYLLSKFCDLAQPLS